MATVTEKATLTPATLPELIGQRAALAPTATAFRQKADGVYQDVSFARFAAEATALATALCVRYAKGERVLLIGENCYATVLGFAALSLAGAVPVPLDAALPPKKIAEIAAQSRAVGVLYSPSQLKKRRAFTGLAAVCFDKFASLIALGKQRRAEGLEPLADRPAAADELAVIFFTAGTTGAPKGVMLSHRALLFTAKGMTEALEITSRDRFLSVLPLSHAYECVCGLLAPLLVGACVAFGEGLSHLLRNMREVHPTCMVTIPYLAEALHHKCWQEIERRGCEAAVRRAIALTDPVRPLSARRALKARMLADVRALFGGSLRTLLILGGAVDVAAQKGLRQLGVFAVQGYGVTECAGLAALGTTTLYRDGAAGLPLPGSQLDVYDPQPDGSGEIRYKGENVMIGYVDDEARTARVMRDGRFYTGDLGRIDELGFLQVLGRVQNCIVTAGGQLICPEELERLLTQSPLVKEAAVVGVLNNDKHNSEPAALILPDLDYAEQLFGVELSEEVLEGCMDEWIAELNQTLAPYQQIGFYALREAPFSRDAAGRIRREGLAEEFAAAMQV